MEAAFQYVKDQDGLDDEQSFPYEGVDYEPCRYNGANRAADDSGFKMLPEGNEHALNTPSPKRDLFLLPLTRQMFRFSSTSKVSTTSPPARPPTSTTVSLPLVMAKKMAKSISSSRTRGRPPGATLGTSRWRATRRTTAALPPTPSTPSSPTLTMFSNQARNSALTTDFSTRCYMSTPIHLFRFQLIPFFLSVAPDSLANTQFSYSALF